MSQSLTPWRWLDSPAAVHLTGDRVLRVDGSGSRGWLNSLLTADLRSVAPGAARHALLLTPGGGIVSDAWVVDRGVEGSESLALLLPAEGIERVCNALQKYLLNEEVTLSFDDAVRVVAILGPRGRELLAGPESSLDAYPCARLGREELDVWVPTSQTDGVVARLSAAACHLGGVAVGVSDWTAARVALGVPEARVDIDERMSPHEAGLEGRAVSFTKGCYMGQEVVARQRRQGGLTRRLVQLSIDGAEPVAEGSSVRDLGGEEVGRVTSVAPASEDYRNVLAIAHLKATLAELGTRVTVTERAAEVRLVVGQSGSVLPGIGRPLVT